MPIDFQRHLMDLLRKNQSDLMNLNDENSLAAIYKPLEVKPTVKSAEQLDILFEHNQKLYVAKHIRIAPISDLFPLNFSDSFILRYNETVEAFKVNGHCLNEQHIDNDFNYELSNPEQIQKIAIGIMTSFPFMDHMVAKLHAQLGNINRNDPCLCGSGKKFKKCCMN